MKSATYIVEDVQISVQGVSSSCDGAIVWDLDRIVERIEIDAANNKRHVEVFSAVALRERKGGGVRKK